MKPPKDGNKEIAELKKQTAHEEVLKAQQESPTSPSEGFAGAGSIKPLVEQKNALRGEINLTDRERGFDRRRSKPLRARKLYWVVSRV